MGKCARGGVKTTKTLVIIHIILFDYGVLTMISGECMKRKSLILCVIVSLLVSFSALAEGEPLRGRLPDGRAFRTDAQGVQIVDYIAELELSIDALNRKIEGLENELEHAERGDCSADAAPKVQERDLLGGSIACPPCNCPTVVNDCPPVVCPPAPQIGNCVDNSAELEAAKREIAALRAAPQPADCSAIQAALDNERSKNVECANSLGQARYELEQKKEDNSAAVIKAKDTEIATLRAKIQELQSISSRTSVSGRVPSADRARALTMVRSEIQTEYNRVQRAISQRAGKYQQYSKKANSNVSFKLSALRSSSGKTLSQIKQELQTSNDMRELSSLKGDLRSIQAKVNDDILLIDRMMKK